MRSTYLHDINLTPFPFSVNTELPIPPGVVQCLYVTAHTDASAIVGNSYAYVSSIELNDSGVAASVCIYTAYGSLLLCLVCADYGSSASTNGTISFTASGTVYSVHYNVMLSCGLKEQSGIGTYTGKFILDPACLLMLSDSDLCSNAGKLVLDGKTETVGECLYIKSAGMLNSDDRLCPVLPATQGIRSYTIDKNATVDADAKMINIKDGTEYSKVSSINGVAFGTSPRRDRRLKIEIKPPFSAKAGTNAASYITCELVNAIQNVETDPYAEDPDTTADPGRREVVWCNLNDRIGDAVVLVINGTSKIPNCYGAEDESEQDD